MLSIASILTCFFLFASHIAAQSQFQGCIPSSTVISGVASTGYYALGSSESCSHPGCGPEGGPPSTYCAQYSGTETISLIFPSASEQSASLVSGPLLTDTSVFTSPTTSLSFVTVSTSKALTGTTTLMTPTSTATGLVYDTAAASSSVTVQLTFTGISSSTGVASATANAAPTFVSNPGTEAMIAIFGALAGAAFI